MKFLLTLLLTAILISFTFAQSTNGLVAYYPFNGNANDESGNGNHGTVNGATFILDRFGNANSASSFDGMDDDINFGDVSFFNGVTAASISVWVKYTVHSGNKDPFITKGGIAVLETFSLGIYNDGVSGYMRTEFGGQGSVVSVANSDDNADDGEWHHIVALLENTIPKIYIDGILSSTVGASNVTQIKNQPNDMMMGSTHPSNGKYYKGLLDDVRMYDRALSEAEILELYHEGGWTENILVISPNGGENWQVGGTYDIIWTYNNVDNVKIDYTNNNGTTWLPIISTTPSDGLYAWTVENNPSTQCRVRIQDVGDPSKTDESDNTFKIVYRIPTIFIPGIMASPLFDDVNNNNSLHRNPLTFWNDEYIWADALQITDRVNDDFLDVLQLSDDGISPPPQSNYRIKVAPLWGDNAVTIEELLNIRPLDSYNDLISTLRSNPNNYTLDDFDNDHTEGENLYVFTYDWRKKLSTNASELNNLIENIKNNWNNVDKVNLIGHSMGGLVVKKIINATTRNSINKIIFVATPHQGSPKILSTMGSGELFGILDAVFNNNEIRKIARNMPSAYLLMPSSIYTNTNITNGSDPPTQKLELYEYAFRYPTSINATYQQMLDFYNTITLPGNFTFNSSLNNQEDLERLAIEDVDFGEIEVYNIVGFNDRTIGLVEYWKPISFLNGKFNEKWNLTGDGTVPLRSAEIVNLTKRKADFYVKNEKHDKLPSSEAGLEIIQGLLQEPAITLFSMPNKIYYDPPESYALSTWQAFVSSPVSLHAYDSQGNHTGSISDTTWETNIPNSEYFHGDLRDPHSNKGILLSPDDDYSLNIISLDTTSNFDLVIDKIIDGYVDVSVFFDSIVIKNQTVAICSLPTATQNFKLEMDYNGDGIVDSIILPTIITDIEAQEMVSVKITVFRINQNFPNPFNPTTTIKYQIPELSFVTLKVYDVLGKEVTTLVNDEKQSGIYEVEFNATELPSGIYFYRLQAGDFAETKKMVLLK